MAWDRAAHDAFNLMLGESQERIDLVHKIADEFRAAREAQGPQRDWEGPGSDSDSDAPITPPQSPRREGDGPDISWRAWDRRKWVDISRGIEPKDTGFDKYETWRVHMLSEHAKKVVPKPISPPVSEVSKSGRRPAVPVSER